MSKKSGKRAVRPPANTPLVIEALPALRAGIPLRFFGSAPDQTGAPVGEFIDVELVVPPLNLPSMQALQSQIARFGGEAQVESLRTLCDCLEHALRRNYRNVPRWLIDQSVDVGNMVDVMQAVMDVSGLHRKAFEEGKAKAAAASIGTGSTAT